MLTPRFVDADANSCHVFVIGLRRHTGCCYAPCRADAIFATRCFYFADAAMLPHMLRYAMLLFIDMMLSPHAADIVFMPPFVVELFTPIDTLPFAAFSPLLLTPCCC